MILQVVMVLEGRAIYQSCKLMLPCFPDIMEHDVTPLLGLAPDSIVICLLLV